MVFCTKNSPQYTLYSPGYHDRYCSAMTVLFAVALNNKIFVVYQNQRLQSIILPDFTMSVYASFCNFLFFGLIRALWRSLFIGFSTFYSTIHYENWLLAVAAGSPDSAGSPIAAGSPFYLLLVQ